MIEVLITQGKVAIISDEDFEYVSQFKWHYDRGYAARTIKGGIIYMHRDINQTPKDMQTDHINGDKLDNRRDNLRTCTSTENLRNRKTSNITRNTSGYKGVVWHKKDKRWQAQIGVNSKCKFLGQFKDKKEAAIAYNKAARELFGQFANLNEV